MKTIGIKINTVLEVEDDVAEKFKKSPTGFLKIGAEILGMKILPSPLSTRTASNPPG